MGLERVVVLVDMDCFYVQVEQREKPELIGKPCAVVQYKTYKGGSTIAVSYEARDRGVKRGMMGDEAQGICPEIELVRVPVQRDKADLTKYREAGPEVINVLLQFSKKVERASIDEAFIDLTDEVETRLSQLGGKQILPDMLLHTHVAGWKEQSGGNAREDEGKDQPASKSKEDNRKEQLSKWLDGLQKDTDIRLAVGALITEEMRAAVLEQTKFNCSAGIAHNKILSKLSCGLNKPRKQSILPHDNVPVLFMDLPIGKVRGLGGKLGAAIIEGFKVTNMGDLVQYSEAELQAKIGLKAGVWLYSICRGLEDEPVKPRLLPNSVGCSKNFLGRSCLDTVEKVKFWLGQLADEVAERLKKEENLNCRIAKSLCVHVRQQGHPFTPVRRSCALHAYDTQTVARTALSIIQGLNRAGCHQAAWVPAVICLGLSATKFADVPHHRADHGSLDRYLKTNSGLKSSKSVLGSPTVSGTKPQHLSESFFSTRMSEVQLEEMKDSELDDVTSKGKLGHYFQKLDKEVLDKRKLCIENRELSKEVSVEGKTGSSSVHPHTTKSEGCSFSDKCFGAEYKEKSTSPLHGFFRSRAATNLTGVDCGSHGAEPMGQGKEGVKPEVSVELEDKNYFIGNGVEGHPKMEEPVAIATGCSELDDMARPMDQENWIINSEICSGVKSKDGSSEGKGSQKVEESATVEDEDYVTCDQCKRKISAWDLPEHLDFHVAMTLQEMESKAQMSPSTSAVVNSRTGKRKGSQQGLKPKKLKPDQTNKSILSFFSQK